MNIIKYFILILVLTNLFFLVGCGMETSKSGGQEGQDIPTEDEDTGISDVFEDSEEVSPPEIPA